MNVRDEFQATIPIIRDLMAQSADRWLAPSALAEMTVGALASHTARAVTTIDHYLQKPHPAALPTMDAPGYFLSLTGLSEEIVSDLHRGVRSRAAGEAEAGPTALLERFDRSVVNVLQALSEEPPDRAMAVFGGGVITLDEYLVTRLVEVVVHGDDLAVSLDLEPPQFADETVDRVIECLLRVALGRHGRMAVVRALSRRERDAVEALRVL